MKSKTVLFVLPLMAGSFGVGRWADHGHRAAAVPREHKILYYHDPMHPAYRSDKPGTAPDCGMDLVPVYSDGAPQAGSAKDREKLAEAPGAVHISPEKQQLIGVRVGEVERSSGASTFRTFGRIVPDEARIFRVTPKVDGWIHEIYPVTTGKLVKRGQPLVLVYSREFQNAQQAYIFALNQLNRFKNGDEPDALDRLNLAFNDARINLEGLGMSQDEIALIARTRKILPYVKLVAPATGVVVARNLYPDQRFEKGADFFKIIDLSRVWVAADIFEQEASYIQSGMIARVSLPQSRETAFWAHVSNVLPQFDGNSRTRKVRLEVENAQLTLQPDMYVDLEFAIQTHPALEVPADALIDTGLKKTVFVDRGNGYFEPRPVETGRRVGDRVEIVKGLEAGEHIVVSGNFLIDSESRMQSAGQQIIEAPSQAAPAQRMNMALYKDGRD